MPSRKTYWYSTDRRGELRYQLSGILQPLRDVAVAAAEDYHSNHDGWESSWPIDFFIYESEEGPAVGCFEVERETVPEFYAWERPLEPQALGVDGGASRDAHEVTTPATQKEHPLASAPRGGGETRPLQKEDQESDARLKDVPPVGSPATASTNEPE